MNISPISNYSQHKSASKNMFRPKFGMKYNIENGIEMKIMDDISWHAKRFIAEGEDEFMPNIGVLNVKETGLDLWEALLASIRRFNIEPANQAKKGQINVKEILPYTIDNKPTIAGLLVKVQGEDQNMVHEANFIKNEENKFASILSKLQDDVIENVAAF